MPTYQSKITLDTLQKRRTVQRHLSDFFDHMVGLQIDLTGIGVANQRLWVSTATPIPVDQLDHLGVELVP